MVRACVVLGGSIEPVDTAGYDIVICADSGYSRVLGTGRRPDHLVGDMDSLDPGLLERAVTEGIDIVRYPIDKDISDGEASLKLAIDSGADLIIIEGATGSRSDHMISMFQMLESVPQDIEAWLHIGGDRIRLMREGQWMELTDPPPVISLLPVAEDVRIKTDGLRYDLDGEKLLRGSTRGIHNEASSPKPRIEVIQGSLLLVLSRSIH
ncbi:MAG: thiamine diphosphokinase [Candidatus Thermoplasmatota archaeon]|nr:thiamine diphosphokinase [Candidatus Thermoplasmatota archaeon]